MPDSTETLLKLLDEHGAKLNALLLKLTLREDAAADLLQELFLRLRRSRGFQRAASPDRYLFRAAINLAFDWRKRERSSMAGELIEEDLATWDCPAEKAIRREDLQRALAAMDCLTEANRELIVLRYIHGWSYDELAEHLGSTPHRVRALCSKAVARLRVLLGAGVTTDR